jgi:hypothetical protein
MTPVHQSADLFPMMTDEELADLAVLLPLWPRVASFAPGGRGGGGPARFRQYCHMGVRTRGPDIAISAKRQVADAAARAEAKAVIERWNEQLAASRESVVSHSECPFAWRPRSRWGIAGGQ